MSSFSLWPLVRLTWRAKDTVLQTSVGVRYLSDDCKVPGDPSSVKNVILAKRHTAPPAAITELPLPMRGGPKIFLRPDCEFLNEGV